MAKSVLVIGAGIIGLCTAFSLREAGFEVTVVDEGSGEEGTSFGNAGLIVPSHFVPLASRGMLLNALKMSISRTAPFGSRPWSRGMISWSRQGIRAALGPHARRVAPLIRDLNLLSLREYESLLPAIGLPDLPHHRGVYMVAENDENWAHLREFARWAEELHLETLEVSRAELAEKIGLQAQTRGALFFPGDADIPPPLVMLYLRKQLERLGVMFINGTKIARLEASSEKILLARSPQREFNADEYVLAAGTWSARLAATVGIRLPLMPGKGHSMTVSNIPAPRAPVLLEQSKIAINPMPDGVRISGNLILGDWSPPPNRARVAAVQQRVREVFPEWKDHDFNAEPVWVGFRPCTPDGLPLIGRAKFSNLTVATGHAMMGMSLGPATGRLITQLLQGQKTAVPTGALDPQRKIK